MEFNEGLLRELAAMGDEYGVLSVYVTVDPREDAPGAHVRVRNDLAAVRERARNAMPRDQRMAVEARIDELRGPIEELLDATQSGLGRVLFATVAGGGSESFRLQVRMPDMAVLDEFAYVRPLVAATSETAPEGIIAVARGGVHLVDVRYGMAGDVYRSDFDVDTDDWRSKRGPAGSRSGKSQSVVSHTDRFEDRVEANIARLMRDAAPRVAETVRDRDWERVTITGDPRLVDLIAGDLAQRTGEDPVRAELNVFGFPAQRMAEEMRPVLEETRKRDDRALAERVRDAARAGTTAATGLHDTLGGLNERRVERLILDPERTWRGSRTPDGLLFPDGQVPPDVPEGDLTPVADLGERMIERALASDARVTALAPDAAGVLADSDGIAAQLRW
jgi:hypothetical protein